MALFTGLILYWLILWFIEAADEQTGMTMEGTSSLIGGLDKRLIKGVIG